MTEKVISTRTRQAQQRRERILGASMELFWEKCVEDASMEEVAKRAGAGDGHGVPVFFYKGRAGD
ncbi:MAG: TetR/AcrR family transcriptional regulator [Lachnospiraceae bacterium]